VRFSKRGAAVRRLLDGLVASLRPMPAISSYDVVESESPRRLRTSPPPTLRRLPRP
jgi:hypothetical protein